jgi:hypothetical protein
MEYLNKAATHIPTARHMTEQGEREFFPLVYDGPLIDHFDPLVCDFWIFSTVQKSSIGAIAFEVYAVRIFSSEYNSLDENLKLLQYLKPLNL